MNYININTQETTLPSRVDSTFNVTWENSSDLLKSIGWRIRPDLPAIAEGYERLSVIYVDGYEDTATAVYTDTLIQDRLDREAAERAAAEIQRQLDKPLELKHVENDFLSVCEQLTGSKAKLGFADLETIIANLMVTDPTTATMLTLKLLTINSAGVRTGGIMWWDDVIWHDSL